MSQPPEVGVIHDIGFRHYDGPRLGRGYLLRSLYTESLRGAFGLGRSTKSKVMPFLLLVAATLPALIIALVAGLTNADDLPLKYTSYTVDIGTVVSIFLAAQCPALVSRDLRFRVMPLYFSRPLRRSDYVLAKYAATSSALFILMGFPLVVLYVGALLAKLSVRDQTGGVLAGLAGAVLFAVLLAGIGLLIASITPRRGFGVAAIIAVIVVGGLVGATLQGIAVDSGRHTLAGYLGAVAPFTLVDGVQVWLLGGTSNAPEPPPGHLGGLVFLLVLVAEVAASYVLLQARYRKVSAT
jgi:ABC-2 type transport system permease protein